MVELTSEKSYDTAQRMDALVARVAAAEAAATALAATVAGLSGGPTVVIGTWQDTSAMSTGWGKSTGWFKYQHWTINSTNWLYLSAKLITPGGPGATNVADNTQIVTTALSSFYQPATAVRFPVYCDFTKVNGSSTQTSALELQSDGTIHCFGISTAATRMDVNVFLPLDL